MNRFTLVCLLAIAGCATTDGAKSPAKKSRPSAETFYPLTVGTTWTYEVKQLGDTRTIDVVAQKQNADGYVEDSTGAQFKADAYGVRDQKRYLLRNPVEAGTRWSNVVSVSSVEHYEIVAADQPCDSPAGKWEGCVIVESRNRVQEGVTLVNEVTFAPGVGIVRLSTVLESNGKQIPQTSLALIKFTPPAG